MFSCKWGEESTFSQEKVFVFYKSCLWLWQTSQMLEYILEDGMHIALTVIFLCGLWQFSVTVVLSALKGMHECPS